jgi:Ca-activated chloride channel family protein
MHLVGILSRAIGAVCLAVAFFGVSLAPATAVAKEKVIIVLDSSGSMAGRIRGVRKIDIARRAMRDLLKSWSPNIELGLMAYGHRRKGDCRDIQTLYPVGKVDPRQMLRAVRRLRPIGKTPLGAAVLRAAKTLRYTEEKATVILLSDGKETCGVDPCKLGRALKRDGVDFTAHVIGFDVKRGEERGLKCLAKNTGGRYIPARDAKALARALLRTAREVKRPAKSKPKPVAAKPGVKLVAVYKKGGKQFEGEIGWTIFAPKRDLAGKRKKIASQWRGKSGHIFRNIPAGKYVVQALLADHRHIVREAEIEVRANEAAIYTIVLNIGKVRFDASLSEGGPAYKGDLGWTVFGTKADLAGKRRKIAAFWRAKSGKVFILPAGKWIVEGILADWRFVHAKKTIEVEAGGGEAHSFNFNAGRVRFDASLSEGGPAYKGDLGWTILATKTDLAGKRNKLTGFWRKKSGNVFILPAGKWRVDGILADHRHVHTSKMISVAPGSGTPHAFNFRAAPLRVNVTADGKPFTGEAGWTVYGPPKDALTKKRPKIMSAWRVRSGHVTILPQGTYLLTALNADARKQTGQIELSVAAGKATSVTVDLTKK